METLEELLAKEPPLVRRGIRCPYIVFGKDCDVYRGPIKTREPALFTLDMSGCHGNVSTVNNYIHKGWKVLKWWFPKTVQPQATSDAPDAQLLTENYAMLDQHLRMMAGQFDAEVKAAKEEKSVLQRRVAELEAKAKAKDGK